MNISYVILDEQGNRVGGTTWSKPARLSNGQRLSARFTRIDTNRSWPIMIGFKMCDCDVEVTTLPNNKDWSEYQHVITVVGMDVHKVTEAITKFCQDKLMLTREVPTGLPKLRTIHERLFFLLNYIFRGQTTMVVENPDVNGRWSIC